MSCAGQYRNHSPNDHACKSASLSDVIRQNSRRENKPTRRDIQRRFPDLVEEHVTWDLEQNVSCMYKVEDAKVSSGDQGQEIPATLARD